MKRVALLLIGAVLLFGAVGCSSPPEEAEQEANAAIAAAESVKAAKYAPEEWKMAEDTLQAARSARAAQDDRFALFRSYGDAERLFKSTTVLANNAKSAAEAQMQIVRDETRQLMDRLTGTIDSLSTRLSKVRPGKDTRAEIEMMKQDLLAFAQQLGEAEADYANGDYDAAHTKAKAVEQKVVAFSENMP
ncbi:MAG: hypothetical protein Kow0074_01000 [Candidatus Zixiibacteriota bacterium]